MTPHLTALFLQRILMMKTAISSISLPIAVMTVNYTDYDGYWG